MSHNIYINAQNTASMAYVGERPWHGLGQKLESDHSFEQWLKAAGMDYELVTAPVQFGGTHESVPMMWGKRQVIYRNDTHQPLNIVSDSYKIVQPGEVLYFFESLVEEHNMQLETAGVLKDGAMYWALAKTGNCADIRGDQMENYIMLATSCDGSLATTAKQTSIRVVCNNTLDMAVYHDEAKPAVKVKHSTAFDANGVKDKLGLAIESSADNWNGFVDQMNALAECSVTDNEAKELFAALLNDGTKVERKQPEPVLTSDQELFSTLMQRPVMTELTAINVEGATRPFNSLCDILKNGQGQDTIAAKGTAYGVLNAITRYADHDCGARSEENRRRSAWFGVGENLKNRGVELVAELAQAKGAL